MEDVITPTKVQDLDVIPAGPVPPNPAELLQSKAMTVALRELRNEYDIVICDGAPVIAVTDAAVVASQTDGTVLVVHANKTPRDAAVHAKQLLEQANARILGVVMNKVDPQGQGYYYYYYYHDTE